MFLTIIFVFTSVQWFVYKKNIYQLNNFFYMLYSFLINSITQLLVKKIPATVVTPFKCILIL